MAEAVPSYYTPRSARDTIGGQFAAAFRMVEGQPPMPWQRMVYDLAGEIDPRTGLLWYREVVLLVVRQAGKTSTSRGKITHRCLTEPGSFVLYTAQNRNKSLARLKRSFFGPLSRSPLARELAPPRWAAGSEAVRFRNSSEIFIDAPTKKTAAHGDTLPEAHIDEAFAHHDARIEAAVNPTMITVAGAQKWVMSAAGDSDSTYLWGKVEAGRARCLAGNHGRILYVEFSAPPTADRDDPATWLATHPAIGHTIDLENLQAEHDGMDPDEFNRAYLGWWPTASSRPWVIPKAAVEACMVDEDDTDEWTGIPAWSIDVSPSRDQASIGLAAAHPAARCWVECVAHEPGTGWVIGHLERLSAQFGGRDVALDGSGPAAAMTEDLQGAGFTVHRYGVAERARAIGAIYDDFLAGAIVHGGRQGFLDALKAAVARPVDDVTVWARRRSEDDITEAYAVTLARHLWVQIHGDDYDLDRSLG